MEIVQRNSGANDRRMWLDVNNHVRISGPTVKRVYREGLKLSDLSLVLQYGERLVEGYHLNDKAINQALTNLCDTKYPGVRGRLKELRNLVVVEMMGTIFAIYRMPGSDLAEDGPLQHEFVLH